MMRKLLLLFVLSGALAIGYGGVAFAAWPSTSWTGAGGPPIRLIVEKGYYPTNPDPVHEKYRTNFSVYFQGDTRSSTGAVQIIFTPVDGCNNMEGAPNIRIYHPGADPGEGRSGDCTVPTSISFTKNQNAGGRAVWHADQSVTEYRITVDLEDAVTETQTTGYAFTVSSPQEPTARFGVTPDAEIVFIADKAQGFFTDIAITQQPPCGGASNGRFESYDYDNFNDSRAQKDASGTYRPMSVSLRAVGGGDVARNSVIPAETSDVNARGWYVLPGNVYRPQDIGSGAQDVIGYDGQAGIKYSYILHNFGRNNFASLNLPWTGNPFSCPSSATITPQAYATDGVSSGPNITVEPGTPVVFHASMGVSGLMNPGANTYTWSITGQGSNPGDTRLLTSPVLDNASTSYSVTLNTPGTYCRQTRYLGSTLASGITAVPNPAQACVTVAAKPFFNVVGGDIMSNAGIRSWNDSASQSAAGSQLAALATNDILNFVTGTGLASFGNGSGLAFANTTANIAAGKYGGSYAVGPASQSPPSSTATLASAAVNLTTDFPADGIYKAAGSLQITGGQLPTGRKVTIILPAGSSLYISGNITYGGYTKVSEIPSLTVYVTGGNISVDPGVTELHGVFYASSDFISCGTSTFASVALTGGAGYNTCNNKLTVYGSVTANKLILSRTSGTQRSGNSAETFYYSPEVWLAPSGPSGGAGLPTYDSYISLPPVL